MSCEVAALPFQAYANYETWSIDFEQEDINYMSNISFHLF